MIEPVSSEAPLQNDATSDIPRPLVYRRVPWLFRFDRGPPEATGLALDMYGRAAIIMSGLFIGPALLKLASEAAECEDDESDEDESCGRVYHMKPSSLLTNIAIAAGLLGSLVLPLFGAIVDKTPYRKQVGIYSAVGVTVIKGIEVMVSSKTWFAVAILQVVSGAIYWVHACSCWAYSSELTRDPDQQTKYNTYYFVVLYVSTLLFLFEVLALAYAFNTDDVGTARISQVITFATASICFGVAWRYFFRDRPALSEVPPGSTLVTCGFRKVFQTMRRIHEELPALRFFALSVMCTEAGAGALVTIATTFMSQFLNMEAVEIGGVFLLVLLMGIPGSKVGEKLALLYDPIASAKVCVAGFVATTSVAAVVLTGPEAKNLTYVFGLFWGLELGWLHPMHASIFINIMPKGKEESELMGIFLLAGQILSWLPPLVFTFLNEAGFDMALGLASLNIFFLAGFTFLACMGSYEVALDAVRNPNDEDCATQNEIVTETGGIALPPLA